MTNKKKQHDYFAVDLHGDILSDVSKRRHINEETGVLKRLHYANLQKGQVKIQVLPIFIEYAYQPEGSLRQSILYVASLIHELDESSDIFMRIKNAEDLDKVMASDKIGLMLSFEGVEPIARDFELMAVFQDLGLHMVGLTWNWANTVAEGCVEDSNSGLTFIGRNMVKEMSRLGMMLDVSHLSVKSFWDAIEIQTGPVLASHSNAQGVYKSARNLDDDQIKALAERGGIIGLNFIPKFVGPSGTDYNKLAEHAAYIANLVGIQHVAVGADYVDYLIRAGRYGGKLQNVPTTQRIAGTPDQEDTSKFPSVAELSELYLALLRHGFAQEEAKGVMGEHALKFLKENLPKK